ncbi:RNA polymerase sigma factor [Paenibacillus sp. 481]|uniref:RNA polymerase sigma factor n=1 Tax=Paenibacillus sp. 481 TaxID=2835869 RepID=UPI001E6405D9|nr:sigma-70 family RNA polymerase sigma factor [Paenibacillus sp. 481]UHA75462.1 sigma-70 family RNA polymerase sigma factor [Paenibacillus sp. 481]
MTDVTDIKQVYDQHFQDVYTFVFSLSRNAAIAEEITQETFFKALKTVDTFNGTCKMKVWLFQIAKNTYFTYLNKQKRFEPHTLDDLFSQDDIEQHVINKAEALRIHQILHRLDEPYKEVFTLRVFGELPFNHISQIFGKTESWARVTFHRAKQKIAHQVMEE